MTANEEEDKRKKRKAKKAKKKKKVKKAMSKSRRDALARRKWSNRAAAAAASVEVPVEPRCSNYLGASDPPPAGSPLKAFYDDYKKALGKAVQAVDWPIADSSAKPDKEIAIEWYHVDEVVQRMTSPSTFRFGGADWKSRQSANGWVDDPNLAGVHWAVYDLAGRFVRYFGLDEIP